MSLLRSRLLNSRFGPAWVLLGVMLGLALLTRIALLVRVSGQLDWAWDVPLRVFGYGLISDIAGSSYFVAALALYLALWPHRGFGGRVQRFMLASIFLTGIFTLLFTAAAEWIFWGEFTTRFNFIAVDYLVYTQEVIKNIWQSYPIGWVLGGLVVLDILLYRAIRPLLAPSLSARSGWPGRGLAALLWLALPVLVFYGYDQKSVQTSTQPAVNELAANGIYAFFYAARHSELDYATFYKSKSTLQVYTRLRQLLQTPDAKFISPDPYNLARDITPSGPEKRLNVVLISVESLSAEYMATFGNTQGITPNLDRFAKEGMSFTRFYASGTRTVRGLEALSLALPPTPGQSIVHRPDNERLFSLGKVFTDKGYDAKFVYGGYGAFDNMNYFFANNGYQAVDRSSLNDKDIHYENVWGVADEDLFTLSLREMDKSRAGGKPFFLHIMTTTNHRPYTYPEGRIDIPSKTSREGAVKYTDWAIGDFIKRARSKPWFADTVFVLTADHCAASAGKSDVPVNRYHIPLILYAPKHIPAQVVDRLMGQIDLPPTLLGWLNIGYRSEFFGYDLFKLEPGRERVFMGTYQTVGMMKNDKLVLLSPRQQVRVVKPNVEEGTASPLPPDAALTDDAIAWYQGASEQFRTKRTRWAK